MHKQFLQDDSDFMRDCYTKYSLKGMFVCRTFYDDSSYPCLTDNGENSTSVWDSPRIAFTSRTHYMPLLQAFHLYSTINSNCCLS